MNVPERSSLVAKPLTRKREEAISLPVGIMFVNLAASFYNVGTVWMAQLNYELWAYVGPKEFEVYHGEWWNRIQPVIFPLAGVSTICSLLMLRLRPTGVPTWLLWSGLVFQGGWIAGTLIWWAPLMARLKQVSGDYKDLYQQLLSTHWLRVFFVTGYALLLLAMLFLHFRSTNNTIRPDNS